jgi:hypothetical protein
VRESLAIDAARLLALAWYEYISVVAGLIIVIGGAVAVLTEWGRGVIGITRRLASGRASQPPGAAEPSGEQRQVLNAIYQHFRAHGEPATFRQLDKELDRVGLPLRKNAESMPPGLTTPDVRSRGGFFYPHDALMVTLAGLRYCDGGQDALDLLARVLAYLAKREKPFMPTPTARDLTVSSAEVARALALSTLEQAQARQLIDAFEPNVWTSASHAETGEWTVTLDLERVRRFRGVRDGGEYLVARSGEHSFADRVREEDQRPRFALVGDLPSLELGGPPITLRVENRGPSGDFEAHVVNVTGATPVATPWYVRWRGSTERRQEILTAHHWRLELCVDDAMHGAHGEQWTPGWRFLRPDGESFVAPDGLGSVASRYGLPLRVTLKVTPRSRPECALETTVTLSITDQGRSVLWDRLEVTSDE